MPERLGPYTLSRLIGAGGMADVFLASGPRGPCVVKRPHPHLTSNPDFVRMFLDEAAILARLHHPGIAQIFDLGQERGVYYLAMEYVRGFDLMTISLEHERHGELMAPELGARIVADVADALHFAHEAKDAAGQPLNIIHRDVSPHNVLVSITGEVKLIDFGVARAANTMHRTQAGYVKGKYPYMAPEQITGQVIDRRVDVYALGLLLYELLTNVRAIAGETEVEQIDNARMARVRPVEQLRPNTPLPLRQIIASCLYFHPDGRYATALALKEDLEKFLSYEKRVAGREDLVRLFRVVAAELPLPPDEQDLSRPTEPETPMLGSDSAIVLPEGEVSADLEVVAGLKTSPSAKVKAAAIQLKDMVGELADQGASAPGEGLGKTYVSVKSLPPTAVPDAVGSPTVVRPSSPRLEPPAAAAPIPLTAALSPGSGLAARVTQPVEHAPAQTQPVPATLGPTAEGEQTEPPEPRGRPVMPLVLLGVLSVALVIVVGVALSVRQAREQVASDAGAAPSGPSAVAVVVPPVVDAAVEAGELDAGPELAAPQVATLEIKSTPPADIAVAGTRLGKSPVTTTVQPGTYEVTASGQGFRKTVSVELAAGEARAVAIVVKKGTLVLSVQPFAAITIDGRSLGSPTSYKSLELYEGWYTVGFELSDASLPRPIRKQQRVQVKPSETSRVEVVMTAP